MDNLENLTTAQLIDWYIRNRDWLAEQKRVYENAIDPVREIQETLEAELTARLNADNATSLKTGNGSVVLSKRTSYNVEDSAKFAEHILKTGAIEATQLCPIKEYVNNYFAEHGKLPDGVASYVKHVISVRK